jgi:hypothetical protein
MAKQTDSDRQEPAAFARLAANVKQRLGSIGEPYRVDVWRLWNDRFRVNVCVGAVSITIPHSYFIIADDEGNILSSTPEMPTTA